MADINDLTTWTKAKTFLGASDDDLEMVAHLITSASLWANTHTDRKLKARNYNGDDSDGLYDGDGTRMFYLRQYPVNSITGIYQDASRLFGSETLLPADDYQVYTETGKVVGTDTIFYSGVRTIKAVYNAGYSSVPADLETGILFLLDYWYKALRDHRIGYISLDFADKLIRYEITVPKQITQLFETFRYLGAY